MVLGFDFGMKYIGVATGQTITKTATPLTSIRAVDGIPDWNQIKQLLDKWQPSALVVGKPIQSTATTQLMHSVQKFANRLQEKYKLPVIMVEEHLTTWEAKNLTLSRSAKLTKAQLEQVNAQAAAIILEQWLQNQ